MTGVECVDEYLGDIFSSHFIYGRCQEIDNDDAGGANLVGHTGKGEERETHVQQEQDRRSCIIMTNKNLKAKSMFMYIPYSGRLRIPGW